MRPDIQRAVVPADIQCGANTSAGTPCRRPAGWGTDHPGAGRCKWHGGATRSHRQSAALVLEERQANDILARLDHPEPIEHPVIELLELAARIKAWEEVLRGRLADLRNLEVTDSFGVERERARVVVYERALDRCLRVLVTMTKLDLHTRSLDLKREQAGEVMQLVVSSLHALGLGQHEADFRNKFAELARKRMADQAAARTSQ